MADPRFRSGRRYPDPDVIKDADTNQFLFDLISALNDRDKNEAELPVNREAYPTVSAGNVVIVLNDLLTDFRKAGIIK